MNKILNKLLLASSSLFLLASVANAQNTICYKKNWTSPATIENTPLEGGECKGEFSVKQMKEKGWNVIDIKIESNENKMTYSYLLSTNIQNKDIQSKPATENKKRLSFKPVGVRLDEIVDNKTTIDVGNLIVGQSGIAMHIFDNDKRLIVANAKVIESNTNSSVVEFTKFNDLKQDAIPTSSRTAQKGDILILNYLYTSSLLIAPSQETFQIVRSNFKYNTFLHSDVFAASLKDDDQPLPTTKDIQSFAIEQNLGTIFIVVDNKVNVLDTKSMKILSSYNVDYDKDDSQFPFYTRVEEIKESTFSFIKNFSFSDLNVFKDTKEDEYIDLLKFLRKNKSEESVNGDSQYESYYKTILGL